MLVRVRLKSRLLSTLLEVLAKVCEYDILDETQNLLQTIVTMHVTINAHWSPCISGVSHANVVLLAPSLHCKSIEGHR